MLMEDGCVARLVAKSPCEGLLPVTAGDVTLSEILVEAITSVAALKGQDKAVSATLKDAAGVGLPAPNRTTSKGGVRSVWTARGQAFVLGPAVGPVKGAAVTDQSDGWAVMELSGAGAAAVLARLVPLDLREDVFKTGHTARTLLRHMTCSLTRTGTAKWEIMVFRSMAVTAVEELHTAMKSVAAQV
jgi:sarcosine oxidase subunit gamma